MTAQTSDDVTRPASLRNPGAPAAFTAGLRRHTFLILLMLITGAAYTAWSFQRYDNYLSSGYDLGIFDQTVRQYSMFRAPIVPIKGYEFNILGDHFHPILAALVPLYWIWPDPRVLGIAMAVLIVASAPAVYFFTARRLSKPLSNMIVAGYLAWWPFHSLVNFDFHEIVFAVPILAWIIWALDTDRIRLCLVLSMLLMGVREDMGLVVMMLAICLAVRRHWLLGAALFVVGAGGFLLITRVLIPGFSGTGEFAYWQYSALGATAGAALLYCLMHPAQVLLQLVDHPYKVSLLTALLFPLGWLSMGSIYFLPAIPLLIGRLLSDRITTWTVLFQYNAVLAPVIVMALVDVLSRLVTSRGIKRVLMTVFPAFVLLGLLTSPALYAVRPNPATSKSAAELAARADGLALIPAGTCVIADDRLVPHLLGSNMVAVAGRIDDVATWAILDLGQSDTGGGLDGKSTPEEALHRYQASGWNTVYSRQDITVLHKPGPVAGVCGNYVPAGSGNRPAEP